MRSLDPTEDFAIQLVRRFVVLCEHPRSRSRMLRIVARSSQTEDAPRVFKWLNRALMLPGMRRGRRPMSAMKWELVASQLFGMATMRYLHELEPMASADREVVIAMTAAGVLAVLQGPDEMFTALVVEDEEDLTDLGELEDLEQVVDVPELTSRPAPAGGSALRRAR
ncbi:TetR/AcrR family transcriptional regulator [Nocardioides stalactiti]|uniref:TetR/AcrR family transcriptional regulator n=1 Tax=Nocardioides stalactiti TaxID=2755356 RepID=UPI001602C555|nr:hypothetical protein [Nocardioides stalactiti]